MALWIKNGSVVDCEQKVLHSKCDVLCRDGKIVAIGQAASDQASEDDEVIDATGLWVTPGLIDMHVSIPTLGHPEAETLADSIAAAKAGGFTGIVCMPQTDPVIDYGSLVEYILLKSQQQGFPVYPVGALTVGQAGESLSDMGDLKRCGAVGFSDTGQPLMNSEVMRRAMEYAKMFDRSVMVQCEDTDLSSDGVMHEGYRSTVLGLKGIPRQAEFMMVARNIALAEMTDCPIHLQLISTAESVALIAEAKERGVAVTAETAPEYFSLSCDTMKAYDTMSKINPPLRGREDLQVIRQAVVDGVIDVVVSSHCPVSDENKDLEFERAPFGAVGLETVLGASLTEFKGDEQMMVQVLSQMSLQPAKILGLESKGLVKEQYDADLTLIDPTLEWSVNADDFASRCRNTPFSGKSFSGKAVMTVLAGQVIHRECS